VEQLKNFLKSEAEEDSTLTLPAFFNDNANVEYTAVDSELIFDNNNEQHKTNTYLEERQRTITAFSSSSRSISQKMFYSNAIFALSEVERLQSGQHHSNIIALVGPASSGKTMLMKSMLQNEPALNRYYDYIFYLDCEHIDFESKTNLLQFLVPTLPYQWICDKYDCLDVLNELNLSDNVLILIDGYTQSQAQLHSLESKQSNAKEFSLKTVKTQFVTSLEKLTDAKTFIQSILSRKILIKAKVIVTARNYCFCNMERSFRDYPRLEIAGLGLEAQKKLCQFVSEENSAKIFDFICSYPSLHVLCSFPESCSAVMYVVNVFLKQKRDNNPLLAIPLTRVAIATYAILVRSKNLKLENKDLKQLASLAWMQIEDGLLINLRESDLPDECHYDTFSLLMQEFIVEDKTGLKCIRKFHILWLEILAALHFVLYMEVEDFQNFLKDAFKNLKINNYRFVVAHVCALLYDTETIKCLKMLLPFYEVDTQKVKAFNEGIELQMRLDKSFQSLLLLCCLAHSKLDEALAGECVTQFDHLIEVGGDIYPIDVAGLWYVLSKSKENMTLLIRENANFVQEKSKYQFVLAMLKFSNIKVTLE